MSKRVYVFDTTLRDGEQVPGARLNVDEKILDPIFFELQEVIDMGLNDFDAFKSSQYFRIFRISLLRSSQRASSSRLTSSK